MNFDFSPIQVELQNGLTKYFSKNYGFDKRQEYARESAGFSEDAWKHYAEIGLLALSFPESYGGLNEIDESTESGKKTLAANNAVDAMWILEHFGAALCLEPYLSTVVMGGGTLLSSGSVAQKSTWIPKIASGELRIAIAIEEPSSRYSSERVQLSAKLSEKSSPGSKSWHLTGLKSAVFSANSAQYILVSSRTSGSIADRNGISLFLVPVDAKGIKLTNYTTHDGGRASDIEFDQVTVTEEHLIGACDSGVEILEDMVARANAALCGEAVGIMSTLCELTLAYLKTRQQFGVPIGKFQALQHRMADMIVATEQAKSMAFLAAQAHADSDSKKRLRDISAAKAYICKSARQVGQEAIQLHGGMGVTNELSVGHYFKRLTLITQTFGDFNHHIGLVSDYLL